VMVDGHPFTMPRDPLQAFHATRAQTIASFRVVSAGTAGARDTGFIFGAALPPAAVESVVGGGLSIAQPTDPHDSSSTREISIDKHTFTVPTDAVAAFLAICEMTIASFCALRRAPRPRQ
jgi:hypothetical protein